MKLRECCQQFCISKPILTNKGFTLFNYHLYFQTMSSSTSEPKAQAIFFAQTRQRKAPQKAQADINSSDWVASNNTEADLSALPQAQHQQLPSEEAGSTLSSRIACVVKFVLFFIFTRWFIRYFEVDRSLRNEPGTPRIVMAWLYLALCSSMPFVFVYLYASIWRRRVLSEPLDLQHWQASCSSLVHVATIGLLLAWIFAFIALFPGFGLMSIVVVLVCTICAAAMVDAVDGIF
ncbi:hypothetical protein BX070DRAFT_225233 [Coemansia spiralis]|nr:hypothetical protein BX070DRAFT_225233 [Coemansia spiralis]